MDPERVVPSEETEVVVVVVVVVAVVAIESAVESDIYEPALLALERGRPPSCCSAASRACPTLPTCASAAFMNPANLANPDTGPFNL